MDKDKKECLCSEPITTFAFVTGKKIEELINKEMNNQKELNQLMEAKILDFYMQLRKSALEERIQAELIEMDTPYNGILQLYRKHFSIETNKEGKI